MKKLNVVFASVCLALATFCLVACGGIAGKYKAEDSIKLGDFSYTVSYVLEIKNDGSYTLTTTDKDNTSTVSGTWTKDEEKEDTYNLKSNSLLGGGVLTVKDGKISFNGKTFTK